MKSKKRVAPKDIGKKSGNILPPKKPNGSVATQFKPGNALGGRPKGSRNKFAEQFFKDFLADWEVAGASAIQACRLDDPATYCRIAASLIPKELVLKDDESILNTFLENLSTEELRGLITAITKGTAGSGIEAGRHKALPRSQPDGVH